MFLDCPAYLDEEGAIRCGLPAEVRCRFTMRSTDGPIESAMIRCPAGHWFNGAIESLTWDGKDTRHPRSAAGPPSGRHRTPQRTQDSHDDGGRPGTRDFPSRKRREVSRPSTAPAYYLGRPAALWITAMRPRSPRSPRMQRFPRHCHQEPRRRLARAMTHPASAALPPAALTCENTACRFLRAILQAVLRAVMPGARPAPQPTVEPPRCAERRPVIARRAP